MSLRDAIAEIPIVNDHTHIFGTGEVLDYEAPGRWAADLTPEGLVAGLSGLGMNETASMRLSEEPARLRDLWLSLYSGRRTIFPVRAMTRFLNDWLGLAADEITPENAPLFVEHLCERLPVGTDALYERLAALTNTEVWLCNHGSLANLDRCEPRTTMGRFRWVPYAFSDAVSLNRTAVGLGLEPPQTEQETRDVMIAVLRRAKDLGAVAIKGGAYAYSLSRPFAPDVANVARLKAAKARLDEGAPQSGDAVAFADALTVITAEAASVVGLPVQIHVGLIWSASGPTRIPEIMDLTPLFYHCPETTFVVFHGGYPRIDDLAHVAATMTNVRAECNWVPYWAGLSFRDVIGRWIDMIPCDRILYGSDAGGLTACVHDAITRQGLAEALEERVERGLFSRRMALEIADAILRSNSIATYGLQLSAGAPATR